MADAPRDGNGATAKLACLNTDTVQGQNLVPLAISSNGLLRINRTDTVNFTMQPVDPRDENYIGCWLFKGVDGNVYPAVADAAGALLVDL